MTQNILSIIIMRSPLDFDLEVLSHTFKYHVHYSYNVYSCTVGRIILCTHTISDYMYVVLGYHSNGFYYKGGGNR